MIGEIIMRERRKMHLTQRELAEKVGVSRCTINKIENNNISEMKAKTAVKISDVLNIPVSLFLSDK